MQGLSAENALGTNENAEKHIAKSSALDAIGQYDVTSPGSPSDEDTQNDVNESLPQSHQRLWIGAYLAMQP